MLNQAQNNAALQGGQAAAQHLAASMPSRPLERIASEADRLARLGYNIQSFLDRFHGNPQTPALPGNAGSAPIQIGYRNEIDRLSANVDVLDNLIQALGEAG